MDGIISENYIPQFLAVFAGYTGLMFIWPLTVFASFLRGKRKYYQLFFCICSMFIVSSLITCIFGAFGILNQFATCLVFYGIFGVALLWHIVQHIRRYRALEEGEVFEIPVISGIALWFYNFRQRFKKENRDPSKESPYIELVLNILLVLIIGAIVFHLGEYARATEQFGFMDMKQHQAWVEGFMDGKFCEGGVYTFGMHFVMYMLCAVFGESPFYVTLYIGNIAALVFMIALYFLLKKIFRSKMAIVATFALILIIMTTVTQFSSDERMVFDGMHRFRWANSQEFCMFATVLAPVCIANFLQNKKTPMLNKNNVAWLILFGLSVATTLVTYFQTTIILLIFSIIMTLVCIKFNPFKLLALGVSFLGGAIAAVIPLTIAFIKVQKIDDTLNMELQSIGAGQNAYSQITDVVQSDPEANGLTTFWNDVVNILFHRDFTVAFLIALAIGLAVFIYCIVKKRVVVRGYTFALASLVVFFIIFASPILGLPHLLAGYRVVLPLFIMIATVCCFVIDLITDTTDVQEA